MALPNPPKFVLEDFIATAQSATPPELHPFFESFKSLYTRKWVSFHSFGRETTEGFSNFLDYGIS